MTALNCGKFKKGSLGFTLLELLIAMAMGIVVMSGVVSVLVVSKSNYITERELATLQENARFALKFLTDEIQMAGYTGCNSDALYVANSVDFDPADDWLLSNTGIEGYDEAGWVTFPAAFKDDASIYSDVVTVRRAEQSGLRIASNPAHNVNAATIPTNGPNNTEPGTIMVIASADCSQVGIFQMTGPNNTGTSQVNHTTGGAGLSPGNCTGFLGGNFDCSSPGSAQGKSYPPGSLVLKMKSQAFYIGESSIGNNIPALYRLALTEATASSSTYGTVQEELVQGVEIMQISYGIDLVGGDGLADQYIDADDASMDWDAVVSVRLNMRMRSIYPVYNENTPFGEFMGIADTDGSDRFMRQIVGTTIKIRNR